MMRKLILLVALLAAPLAAPLQAQQVVPQLSLDKTSGKLQLRNPVTGANSDLNGVTRAETGAVRRTVTDKLNEHLDIKDFGAKGNGSVDDTAAAQAWVNACIATGSVCYAGPGNYKITSTVTIPGAVHITGASKDKTTFLLATATLIGFKITGTAPVVWDHMGFAYTITPTAGAAIQVDPGSGNENDNSSFDNLYFNNTKTGLVFVRAAYWTLTRSQFYAGVGNQVVIFNLNNTDTGDSVFSENKCIFAPSTDPTRECIYWGSSGGLRVVNNKFLNGYRGIEWEIGSGVTGTITVANNSFENQTGDGMFFGQSTSGVGTYTKVTVSGNEFLGFGNANAVRFNNTATSARWMFGFTFTGNNIEINGDNTGSYPIGLLLSQTQFATVTGNIIRCTGTTTGSYGFYADASVDRMGHGGNLISGCTTNVSDASTNPFTAF